MSRLLTTGPHDIDTHEEDVTEEFEPVRKGYERVDGELVERLPMGAEAGFVIGRIFRLLDDYCQTTRLGLALIGEVGYRCFPHKPKQVRKPDVAIILGDPATLILPREEFRVVPAIVVEVISPHERVEELSDKIEDFRSAGTRLIWCVEPRHRVVTIQRIHGTITRLTDPGILSGEDVLPGFAVPLTAFLPILPAPTPASG